MNKDNLMKNIFNEKYIYNNSSHSRIYPYEYIFYGPLYSPSS